MRTAWAPDRRGRGVARSASSARPPGRRGLRTRGAAAGGSAGGGGGGGRRLVASAAPPARPRALAPVRVGAERVIRTVVGLRPFRPSGFVLRVERLGEKVIVHN